MMVYMSFVSLLFMMGLLSFSMFRKHLLLMLLSLEFLVLSLFLGLFIYLSYYSNEYFLGLVYLVMSVCEGCLGLSLLVLMVRSQGNDYVMVMNLLW
uniref:NADH dehydrogenase subunit 4L n=1 Tax=Adiscus speciosus TaxID=2978449 RepID=UPI0021CCE371|nr:NADH dehydrogenase subunit 4L [Adiscus speciosus]UWV18193.1 NADH dehydrogenase subunit 4L [Adiscus speciosus]